MEANEVTADGDRRALEEFFTSMRGPSWIRRDNWLSPLPLGQWHGVNVNEFGRTTGIVLKGNRLIGRSYESGSLKGGVEALPWLQIIDLSHNALGEAGSILLRTALVNASLLQTLKLSFNRIGAEGVASLSEVLRNFQSLKILELEGNDIGATGAASLSVALVNMSSLQTLNLSGNRIGAAGAAFVSAALINLSSLLHLDISRNRIGAAGTVSMSNSLANLSSLLTLNLERNAVGAAGISSLSGALVNMSSLQTLHLAFNGILDEGEASLNATLFDQSSKHTPNIGFEDIVAGATSSLNAALANLPSLQTLNFKGGVYDSVEDVPRRSSSGNLASLQTQNLDANVTDTEELSSLSKALATLSSLQTLDLGLNRLSAAGAASVSAALANLSSLQTLNAGLNAIAARAASYLSEALAELSLLEESDVDGKDKGAQVAASFSAMLANLSSLQTLDLEGNAIGSTGAALLSAALVNLSSLRSLNLRGNTIGAEGAASLSAALSNLPSLETLDLEENCIGVAGAASLSAVLVHLSSLQTLRLALNDIGAVGAASLSAALMNMSSLQILDLGSNDIGKARASSLSTALANLTSLRSLDLSDNNIDAAVTASLVQAVANLSSLQLLNLGSNRIGVTGSASLGMALVKLSSLQTLNLTKNLIGAEGAAALTSSLANMTSLHTLYFGSNDIFAKGAASLSEALTNLSLLKILDLEGNDIGVGGATSLSAALENLSLLEILNLGSNDICDRGAAVVGSSILNCQSLRSIDFSDNKITRIDLRVFLMPSLVLCSISNNPDLKQPPAYLGSDIVDLRRYCESELTRFDMLKLAIVGHEGVGKTVLTQRLMGRHDQADRYLAFNRTVDRQGETRGVHHEEWVIEDTGHHSRLKLLVWDHAGNHVYRSMHQCFFTSQALYLLVFDLMRPVDESAQQLCDWVRSIHASVRCPVFCVVGTKLDKVSDMTAARMVFVGVMDKLDQYRIKAAQRLGKKPFVLANKLSTRLQPDDCWLVSGRPEEQWRRTTDALRRMLIDLIEHPDTKQHFPRLHEEKPASWQRLDHTLNKIVDSCLADQSLHYPSVVEKCALLAAAPSASRSLTAPSADHVNDALEFSHECGTRLWYRRYPGLRERVFHDPTAITELLKILMEPAHLQKAYIKTVHLASTDSEGVVDSAALKRLRHGRLLGRHVAILWAAFGAKFGLHGDELCNVVLDLLQRFHLVVQEEENGGDRNEAVYLCPNLVRDYSGECLLLQEGYRYLAVDFVFEGHRAPRELFAKLTVILYSRRAEWWDRMRCSEDDDDVLTVYSYCLTDASKFELRQFASREAECEALKVECEGEGEGEDPTHKIRALIRMSELGDSQDGDAPHGAPLVAKLIFDTMIALKESSFPGITFTTVIVLDAKPTYLASAEDEMSGARFPLASIPMLEDGSGLARAGGRLQPQFPAGAEDLDVSLLWPVGPIEIMTSPLQVAGGGQQHFLSHDTARGRQGRDDNAQVKRISHAADPHAADAAADAGSAHLPQLSAKGWIRGSVANHVVSFVVTLTAVAVGTVAVGLMSLSLGLPVVELEGMPPLLLESDLTKVALAILAGVCCIILVGLFWLH